MMQIEISKIRPRQDARILREHVIERHADSIAEHGLLNPVRVRPQSDGTYELTMGGHRVAAHRKLGLVMIEARIETDDDLKAEAIAIDENLCRAELSAAEEAIAVACDETRNPVAFTRYHRVEAE